MSKTLISKTLKALNPKKYEDPKEAIDAIEKIYNDQIDFLRGKFQDYVDGKDIKGRVSGFYPEIRMTTQYAKRADSRMSFGFAPRPGTYSTTVTRPDLFRRYYHEQLRLLRSNHDVPIEIGLSEVAIPIHFALGTDFHLEGQLDINKLRDLPDIFDVPNLDIMDDEIANGTYVPTAGGEHPLSLFTAPRVDLSLQRLKHYTGTSEEYFQNYVIFTNYQFYIDEFIRIGEKLVTENEGKTGGHDGYDLFIQPDPRKRLPQMPAYHLTRPDGSGITMVNIGVGPSNAKTITDHIAVLRPHAWLMLGHCAGLRNSQALGDYVLAHGYLREDHILDDDLPCSIPVPALAEIQQALEKAVGEVCGVEGYDVKKIMRTGTVATTDDRNWELRSFLRQNRRLSQSRAIAMDMESGTIAANGFRLRVPYGTLLCVSDKPLHGQLKLPGMADSFYRERIDQHLKVGLRTLELLRETPPEKLHSRKLRSFDEVAFQ